MAVASYEAGVAFLTSFGAALPIIGAIAFASAALYVAWEKDFGGMRTTLTRWYEGVKDVIEGVVALFSSQDGGIGTISAELHDKLVDKGLWGVTKAIFLWGNRLLEFFKGVWAGFSYGVGVAAQVLGLLWYPIGKLLDGLVWLAKATGLADKSFGGLNNVSQQSIDVAKILGTVVGVVTAAYFGSQAAMMAASVAAKAWTATQWLLNAAMTANPIGIIIVAVGLLIAGVVYLIAKLDDLRDMWTALVNDPALAKLASALGVENAGNNKAAATQAYVRMIKRETRREETGHTGIMSQAADTITGTDLADDKDYEGVKRGVGFVPQLMAGGGAPSQEMMEQLTRLMREQQPDLVSHNHIYLDSEQIHESVTRTERDKAERRGE
jgi:hypothetical protein